MTAWMLKPKDLYSNSRFMFNYEILGWSATEIITIVALSDVVSLLLINLQRSQCYMNTINLVEYDFRLIESSRPNQLKRSSNF